MTTPNQDEREALIAAIAGGTISCAHGYSNLAHDDAANIADTFVDLAVNFHRTPVPSVVTTVEDHAVTLEIADGGYHGRFVCNAPPESLCHAVWSCDCEQWYEECIRNGVPAHKPDPEDAERWHAGKFGDGCNLQTWFDESDESLSGTVTVPVIASFEGDYYEFTLTPTSPPPSEVRVTGEQVEAMITHMTGVTCSERDAREVIADLLAVANIPVAGEES